MRRMSGGFRHASARLTRRTGTSVLTKAGVIRDEVVVRTAAPVMARCSMTKGLSVMDGSLQLSLPEIIGPSLVAMPAWQSPDVAGRSWH